MLTYLDDDGQAIEPEWYMPVLPMVLVNGAEGIGTGWSTSVPTYNPRDIVANLKRRFAGEPMAEMVPYFEGFTGATEQKDAKSFVVSGIISQISDTVVEVTELPVRMWTQAYKELL